MMELTRTIYCKAELIVPKVDGVPLHMPHSQWDWGNDTYWGAGALGDKFIPDTFPGGSKMMSICYIHDNMYVLGDPTVACFNEIQRAFFLNMANAVFAQIEDRSSQKDNADLYRACTYYSAVEASTSSYWKIKKIQGHKVP